jgi:DNA-binding XRE family transcriptional regulator
MVFNRKGLLVLMAEQGLTAYALAQRAGVAKQSLSRILNGATDPNLTTAVKLADALQCSLDVLVHRSAVEPVPPKKRGRPRKP